MRRIIHLLLAVLLVAALTIGVSAVNAAQSVGSYVTVSPDGSCSVTMTAMLRIEKGEEKLQFPLPKDAANVTLNGSRARSYVSGNARMVDLSGILGGMTGQFSITLNYTIDDIIHTTEEETLELQLPLLAGFAYPVESLEFSVTLPVEPVEKPHFSSGYHQANIEKDLTVSTSGAMVTGVTNQPLKDHETLLMTLAVMPEQFRQTAVIVPDFAFCNTAMLVCAGLALLYWILFLRNIPPLAARQTTAPEGYGAGELRSVLTLQGADLSMMVFTWAQLGYLRIQWERNGHVTLHRQMDMGNERSGFEQRCFRNLFGRRGRVDTAGEHYAELCRQVEKQLPNIQPLVHPRAGNLKVFRVLAGLVGLFGGINLGLALGEGAALQWLLVGVLTVLGFMGSLHMQRWTEALFLRNREKLWLSLGIGGLWLLLDVFTPVNAASLWVVGAQFLAGLMGFFGGRRTEEGRQAMAQVLGLRRYLRTVSRTQLEGICQRNPEYFHMLVPDALALGLDKRFAKRFGKMRLPDCPYITVNTESQLTAAQWSALLRSVVRAMDLQKQRRPIQRMLALLQGFTK